MNQMTNGELEVEQEIQALFSASINVARPILKNVPVGKTAAGYLFLTNKKQLFLYVKSKSSLTVGDVGKIVSRMGMVAELYVPPKNQPHYFSEVAKRKFCEVFPGRKVISVDDLRFYRTLVPYNPALILISEVKNGEVFSYDSENSGKWQLCARFSYRRIKTS